MRVAKMFSDDATMSYFCLLLSPSSKTLFKVNLFMKMRLYPSSTVVSFAALMNCSHAPAALSHYSFLFNMWRPSLLRSEYSKKAYHSRRLPFFPPPICLHPTPPPVLNITPGNSKSFWMITAQMADCRKWKT